MTRRQQNSTILKKTTEKNPLVFLQGKKSQETIGGGLQNCLKVQLSLLPIKVNHNTAFISYTALQK